MRMMQAIVLESSNRIKPTNENVSQDTNLLHQTHETSYRTISTFVEGMSDPNSGVTHVSSIWKCKTFSSELEDKESSNIENTTLDKSPHWSVIRYLQVTWVIFSNQHLSEPALEMLLGEYDVLHWQKDSRCIRYQGTCVQNYKWLWNLGRLKVMEASTRIESREYTFLMNPRLHLLVGYPLAVWRWPYKGWH